MQLAQDKSKALNLILELKTIPTVLGGFPHVCLLQVAGALKDAPAGPSKTTSA